MLVREAVEADIPRMVAMGRRLFERSGWPSWVSCDDASMEATLRGMMEADTAAVLIGEHGFAGVMVTPAYFNHAILTGQKVWWWLEPGCLTERRDLWAAMEGWARSKGAAIFFTSCAEGLAPKAISRLYERAGYRRSGMSFTKEL